VCVARDLSNYSEAQWESLLQKPELVFARATPQDKLLIVSGSTIMIKGPRRGSPGTTQPSGRV
jgi:hypothetical protein